MALCLWSVVVDANDRTTLARFWAAALGWDCSEDDGFSSVTGGDGPLRRLEFVTTPNGKQSANWAHFDLSSRTADAQLATVERLLELGARRIDVGQGPDSPHIVLADPEGNELCVPEPGNSFVDSDGLLGSLTCVGSPAVGYFWREALGWSLVWDHDDETAIRSASGGRFLTFGGPPEAPKSMKNRLHIDVAPPEGDDQQAEVERLLSLGARRVDIGQGEVPWAVMIDPDGNEFCVLTPR